MFKCLAFLLLVAFVSGQEDHNIVPYGDLNVTDSEIEGHIINGNPAYVGEFPWQAHLVLDDRYLCGGALISNRWVVTAGHCLYGRRYARVTLGVVKIGDPAQTVILTRSLYVHPNYNSPNLLNNDYALANLNTNVPLSNRVFPIALGNAYLGGEVVVLISGFGRTQQNSPPSNILYWMSTKTMTNAQCAAYYGTGTVRANTLCTYAISKGTCFGDSGGPVVQKVGTANYLVGVVSFVSAAGCISGPSGHARISSDRPWIKQMTGL